MCNDEITFQKYWWMVRILNDPMEEYLEVMISLDYTM